MKKIKNYLLAFIIPFIICLGFFFFKGTLNDIENIYVSDLRLQHIVFLSYLKNVLLGNASIFYSFHAGMGNLMLSNIIFYCISPINVLLLFFKDIRYSILFIYIIKISLAGLTMYMLLKSKSDKDSFITILFSTCYALCSFAINYFFCIFWFDCLYLAPLVTIGIDRIFNREKFSLLYILSLALAIICNIQMGFGLCVYSVLYFLYSYSINYSFKDDFKKLIYFGGIFAISSLCAGAISSGLLIAFLSDYSNISAARGITVTTSAGTSNIGYVIKNLFTVGNLKEDYFNNFEPFVYCGLIVTFFSIIYLFSDKIESRKKFCAFCFILVFIISFSIGFINLFWHLSSPVLLNYRYSEYLSLFLTMIAYEAYNVTDRFSTKDKVVFVISLLCGLFIILMYSKEVYVIYAFGFLLVIGALIYLVKCNSKKFEVILCMAVLLETGVNGYLSVYTASQLPFNKTTSYNSVKKLTKYNGFSDDYRVMYDYSYTDNTNDMLLFNNHSSLRYFSSVINGNVTKFFDRNFACVGNNNYRLSAYESPLLLSLMGNKYFYLTREYNNSLYENKASYKIKSYDYELHKNATKNIYLYENPYALSLGYVIEKDVKHKDNMNMIDYQNSIVKAFTGIDKDVLIKLDYDLNSNKDKCANSNYASCNNYIIKNDTDNRTVYVYTLFDEYNLDNVASSYIDVYRPIVISSLDKNLDLTVKYSNYIIPESLIAVTYDEEALISSLDSLRKNMLRDVKINNNKMNAKLDSEKDGILFLSIPYEKKFKIYVDGKKVNYYSLLDDSFIGLDVKKGSHTLKLIYEDDSLGLYALLCVGSLVVTFVLYYFMNKKIDIRLEEEERKKQEELEKRLERRKNKKNKKKNNKKGKNR